MWSRRSLLKNCATWAVAAGATARVGQAETQDLFDRLIRGFATPKPTDTIDPATRDARIAWLQANSAPLRSIDPADTDFADLEPLARAIGDARIVMLGEQTHGDGATFLAKCRLVHFLHERLGFDVLSFE